MGTSNWQNISYNIDIVKKLDPKSILDIGVGFGRWGILFREFLEIWGGNNYTGNWKRTIDGIEIFPDYIKEYHKYFYNNIYIENALDFLKHTPNKYDLINCGDVIEHFAKSEANELIELCLKTSQFVLINIPIGSDWKQGSINNNVYETHLSVWENQDFAKYEYSIVKNFKDINGRDYSVILLSKEKIDLSIAYGKYFGVKNFIRNKLKADWLVDWIEKKNNR